jgi:hypothetical protein
LPLTCLRHGERGLAELHLPQPQCVLVSGVAWHGVEWGGVGWSGVGWMKRSRSNNQHKKTDTLH